MGATIERIDTEAIKASVNLAEYAERFTTLHRESATERAGPCPKCGGNDRFHVTATGFFCRECHPIQPGKPWGDVIEFVQWLEGCTFPEACNRLSGAGLPATTERRAPVKKQAPAAWASVKWQQSAERLVSEAHERLFTEGEGEQGRAYLEGRGLHSGTWLTYRLGFAQAALPGTEGRKRAPAVVVPWIVQGKVRAIRYRFLEVQHYTDAEGRERAEKQTAQAGSGFIGVLFGGQALEREQAESRALVLLEGEINAMSVQQVASSAGVDVLSVGSEGQSLTTAMVQALSRYGQIFCWFDKPERARAAQVALPGSVPLQSPGGKDANDLLQAEALGGFLAYVRWQHTPAERLADLHGSLLYAARLWGGIDTGTAQVLTKLGEQSGQPVQVEEVRPGTWQPVLSAA
jgi:hypothetical protein